MLHVRDEARNERGEVGWGSDYVALTLVIGESVSKARPMTRGREVGGGNELVQGSCLV